MEMSAMHKALLVQLWVVLHSCRAFQRYQLLFGNDWGQATVGQMEDVWRKVREREWR